MRSPSTQRPLFSGSGARKGPHWLPGGPTLPSWWGHCGDHLEGQSHLQSHQTVLPALKGLRAADSGHSCPRSGPYPSPSVHVSSPPRHSPKLSWVGLWILISVVQASRICQSQHVRGHIPAWDFYVCGRTCSSGLPCLLSLCHSLVGSPGGPASLEEEARGGLSEGPSLAPPQPPGPALRSVSKDWQNRPLAPLWPTWTMSSSS